MRKLSSPCLLLISFALLITTIRGTARTPSSGQGFTVHLIHRDHIHNPGKDPRQRYVDAFQRSFARVRRHFDMNVPIPPSFHNAAQSEILPDNGEYVLKLSIGTPAFNVYAIADTGSDLTWTQCLPCDECYPQKNPKYDPKSSSTYHDVACPSQQCKLLDTTSCAPPANTCNYTYGYASTSQTKGFLATETLTFMSTEGSPVTLPNVVFGCGHNNTGTFNENEMGIAGLGKGPVSLISQIGTSFGGRRFSQCLVPFHTPPTVTSKISFGSGSEVSGPGTVTTSLVALQDPTYYFVTLYGISVGSTYLPFSSSITKGNMFLDSGTPPTIVPRDFYDRLEAEVKREVELPPIDDPQLRPQLCYGRDVLAKGPVLMVHFDDQADVELKQTSTFIEAKDGIFCFAMTPTDSPGGIFGNFAQTDHLIGFDLESNTVSFKPTDCTKL